jgi:hypothetical protein
LFSLPERKNKHRNSSSRAATVSAKEPLLCQESSTAWWRFRIHWDSKGPVWRVRGAGQVTGLADRLWLMQRLCTDAGKRLWHSQKKTQIVLSSQLTCPLPPLQSLVMNLCLCITWLAQQEGGKREGGERERESTRAFCSATFHEYTSLAQCSEVRLRILTKHQLPRRQDDLGPWLGLRAINSTFHGIDGFCVFLLFLGATVPYLYVCSRASITFSSPPTT